MEAKKIVNSTRNFLAALGEEPRRLNSGLKAEERQDEEKDVKEPKKPRSSKGSPVVVKKKKKPAPKAKLGGKRKASNAKLAWL